MTQKYLLAIDQGTTSTRAVIFDAGLNPISSHQVEFAQFFPNNGWVEHDPEEIWQSCVNCCQNAIEQAAINPNDIVGMGFDNQRETTIVWDQKTGKPVYPAIVWQDRRTANVCSQMAKDENLSRSISYKTGLLLDPYFCATKIAWILDNVNGARERAQQGELLFGTIDSFMLWRFTGGKVHATDATNASRTMLFNIREQKWDQELLDIFNIPESILPKVTDCVSKNISGFDDVKILDSKFAKNKDSDKNQLRRTSSEIDSDNNCSENHFGLTQKNILGAQIPITGIAGDQQAAAIGQACFRPGMVKSTYGTGCFMLMNTGDQIIESQNRLLSTVAYRINGKVCYGLEGSVFIAGAGLKWLRDKLELIKDYSEIEDILQKVKATNGVYLVPAFTGLGAPYWEPDARGALVGMTRDSGRAEIIRATVEAVAYQSKDLLDAMIGDGAVKPSALRVDGGMVNSPAFMQTLSDMLDVPVESPDNVETSVLGAACLAGLGAGVFDSLDDIAKLWRRKNNFEPAMSQELRQDLYSGWQSAVDRVR